MTLYPLTTRERIVLRLRYLQDTVARANVEGRQVGLSIKCKYGHPPDGRLAHSTDPGGCTNDGTSCLCRCHDPEEST